jgi:hypothetical protein
MCDYQNATEDRRHLAAEVGELTACLVAELGRCCWTAEDARNADVRALAAGA